MARPTCPRPAAAPRIFRLLPAGELWHPRDPPRRAHPDARSRPRTLRGQRAFRGAGAGDGRQPVAAPGAYRDRGPQHLRLRHSAAGRAVKPLVIALALLAIGAARIVSTYSEIGITYDEPAHLACGMQFLS